MAKQDKAQAKRERRHERGHSAYALANSTADAQAYREAWTEQKAIARVAREYNQGRLTPEEAGAKVRAIRGEKAE